MTYFLVITGTLFGFLWNDFNAITLGSLTAYETDRISKLYSETTTALSLKRDLKASLINYVSLLNIKINLPTPQRKRSM